LASLPLPPFTPSGWTVNLLSVVVAGVVLVTVQYVHLFKPIIHNRKRKTIFLAF